VVLLVGCGCAWAQAGGELTDQGIGGFLKKKAKDVVKAPDAEKDKQAPDQSPDQRFNDRVLELNVETLARLENALRGEKEFRDGVEARYAKLPTREQYDSCLMQAMMSPEGQAIAKGAADDMAQVQIKLMALHEKKCGKNPNTFDKSEDLKPAAEAGARAGGLTLAQYSIAKERITPFCSSGGLDKVRGSGDLYYVYTPAEVSAIQPKCAQLAGLMPDVAAHPQR
jgi:hypothetical protein